MKKLTTKEYIAAAAGIAVIGMIFYMGRSPLPGADVFSGGASAGSAGAEGDGVSSMDKNTDAKNGSDGQAGFDAMFKDLGIEEIVAGEGAEAGFGSIIEVHYVLTLADGSKIDSSYDRGAPLPVTLGAGQVIPGFDMGLRGMKVGGKRKLTIPPEIGYGAGQVGPIPPNSTLYFEVELVSVKQAP